MSMVLLAIAVLLAVAMLGAAWITIRARRVATAMLAAGLVSLFASVMFLFWRLDVAMTEAAIGSGLTTFLFFFVLGRVRGGSDD
ncbi:MAG: DUF4040 domain-containing protein [Candidatus Thiothrix singaporensis]|uniref:DUF4040 domain-containing protein n=1 Tax=Candidatus Thiothrix singaporensis TaxID=2799669 RepID=A0A7L6ATW8_9GAMM|nr:MAG: DUF4040 domain-containing protein [Candidatus Thiothrix singaporensis]